MEALDQRSRELQRAAVSEVLSDDGLVLRMADGQVLVYDEAPGKLARPTLHAVVMPDGQTQVFQTRRFRRAATPDRRAAAPHPSKA